MTSERIKQLLDEGEGLTIEYKRYEKKLNNSVFETVCSFSNRYGGYILLGVDDDGTVIGVNLDAVASIKKNFVNMLNNPQKISPTLFISLEETKIDGKLILYAYIPVSSQVEYCSGKIIEGDVFKTIVPLEVIADKVADKVADKLTLGEKSFLQLIMPFFDDNEWITNSIARELSGRSEGSVKRFLRNLVAKNVLEMHGERKNRQYRLSK